MTEGTSRILLKQGNVIPFLCLGYYATMVFIAPGFFSVNNSWNLLYNLIPLLLLSLGQTYVMLTGGIDLSVTSIIAVTSVVGGYLMSSDTGIWSGSFEAITAGVTGMVFVGMFIGLINGLSVAKLGMPAFMVTLTTMMFFSGFAIWMTKSQNIYNLPEPFVRMPYSNLIGIPIPVILGSFILIISYLILNKTLYGEWIYATGLNRKTARVSGVRIHNTLLFAYIFSGLCASLSSLLYTARLETGTPVMGQNILLDIIGAVVIGGTSLFGGKGTIKGTFFGVLFIVLLDNSLNLIGLSYFLIMMVKGFVILLAAVIYVLREKE